MIDNICAIIVTYNTGKQYFKNFLSIKNQVNHIIIIDNGSENETIETLNILESQNKNLKIIYNDTNLGLATAQNIGIDWAISNGYEWLLFLDDDSYADKEMVSVMRRFYNTYPEQEELAILAPHISESILTKDGTYYYPENKYFTVNSNFFTMKKKFKNKQYMDVYFAIASGSLIKAHIFNKIGKFPDNFFIDYIDIEFSLRVVQAGYKIITLRKSILNHRLGNKKLYNFLGLKIITLNHNSFRKYYIAKNRMKVWRLYLCKFPKFIVYDMVASVIFFIKIILFETDKLGKIKATFKGFYDGFREKVL